MKQLSELNEKPKVDSSFKIWRTRDKRLIEREDEKSEFLHEEVGFSLPVNIRALIQTLWQSVSRLFY